MRLRRADQGQGSEFQDALGRESERTPPVFWNDLPNPDRAERTSPLRP